MRPTTGWPRFFVVIAVIEALTWVGLLVGMFLKYVTETTEVGVRIFGSLHGAAFITYLVATAVTARRLRWDVKTVLLALAASIPPLFTVLFERWAIRRGHLHDERPAGQTVPAA